MFFTSLRTFFNSEIEGKGSCRMFNICQVLFKYAILLQSLNRYMINYCNKKLCLGLMAIAEAGRSIED